MSAGKKKIQLEKKKYRHPAKGVSEWVESIFSREKNTTPLLLVCCFRKIKNIQLLYMIVKLYNCQKKWSNGQKIALFGSEFKKMDVRFFWLGIISGGSDV